MQLLTCRDCGKQFKCKVVQAHFCPSCKKEKTTCSCGGSKSIKATNCRACSYANKRGKTYLEIYGTKTPPCGYQRGDKNISKRPEIKEKISRGVTRAYTPKLREQRGQQLREYNLKHGYSFGKRVLLNSRGEKFRSKLEVNFSELLIRNNISYKYEHRIKMINGHYKIVDFKIGDILVEISGFAHKSWQDDFTAKMHFLRQSTDAMILVLTYDKELINMLLRVADTNLFIGEISNENRILETLKWIAAITQTNMEFEEHLIKEGIAK